MGKQIDIVLEAFGNKRLKATYAPEQIQGKQLHEIVDDMMNKKWNDGEEKMAHSLIAEEMNASKGYVTSIGTGGINSGRPVKFQPARLDERIDVYTKQELPNNTLRIAVNGDHIVGEYHGYKSF